VGYRIVRMSRELFEMMFVEGYTLPTRDGYRMRVTKGLPEGARLEEVAGAGSLIGGIDVLLRFSHPSWEDTPPGEPIPELRVESTMEQIAPSAAVPMTFTGATTVGPFAPQSGATYLLRQRNPAPGGWTDNRLGGTDEPDAPTIVGG
jgi:hypothetical protein